MNKFCFRLAPVKIHTKVYENKDRGIYSTDIVYVWKRRWNKPTL